MASSLELSQGLLNILPAGVLNYNVGFSPSNIAQCGLLPGGLFSTNYPRGYITIMKGTMPSAPDLVTIPSADVLIEYSVASGAFIVQTNVNPVVISTGYLAATASGTATWFIWHVRDGLGVIYQQAIGTVGISGSGSDLEISDVTVTTGQMYRVLNLRLLFNGTFIPAPPVDTAVALYHLDSFTTDVDGNKISNSAIGTGFVNLKSYDPLVISNTVFQFAAGGSIEMDGGTTGDSSFSATTEVSSQWTLEFSTSWPTGASSGSGGGLIRIPSNSAYEISFSTSVVPGSYPMTFPGAGTIDAVFTEWTQWAVVVDITNNTTKIFKNGVLTLTGDASTLPTAAFPFSMSLGHSGFNYNYGYPIYIDEVRVSNSLVYSADYVPSAVPFSPPGP